MSDTGCTFRRNNLKQQRRAYIIDCVKVAEVAELADAADSKSVELITRVGSSPSFGTKKKLDPAGDAGFFIFTCFIQ